VAICHQRIARRDCLLRPPERQRVDHEALSDRTRHSAGQTPDDGTPNPAREPHLDGIEQCAQQHQEPRAHGACELQPRARRFLFLGFSFFFSSVSIETYFGTQLRGRVGYCASRLTLVAGALEATATLLIASVSTHSGKKLSSTTEEHRTRKDNAPTNAQRCQRKPAAAGFPRSTPNTQTKKPRAPATLGAGI
jgi:hypothetical protein